MAVHVASSDVRGLAPRITGPRAGGTLVWIAAAAISAGVLFAGLAAQDSRAVLAAGICAAFGITFAISPTAGIALMVILRPSLDLWADRPIAALGGQALNPAS